MPSGLHGMRCLGMPPTRVKAFRTMMGRGSLGRAAGRRGTAQGRRQQRLVGLKPLWNRVSDPTGAIIICLVIGITQPSSQRVGTRWTC